MHLVRMSVWLIQSIAIEQKNKSTYVQKCLSNMDLPYISETGSVWDAPGF